MPEDLINLYLKHGLVDEAACFIMEYIQYQFELPTARLSKRWIPITAIEQTVRLLDDQQTKKYKKSLMQSLDLLSAKIY